MGEVKYANAAQIVGASHWVALAPFPSPYHLAPPLCYYGEGAGGEVKKHDLRATLVGEGAGG